VAGEQLLTGDELEFLDLLAKSANLFRRITGGGTQANNDWAEAADKIHQLQTTVMSQAAARAYPEKFRLLGNTMPRGRVGT